MHADKNKYEYFNNLIETCKIALFTRATPGSSLVTDKGADKIALTQNMAQILHFSG